MTKIRKILLGAAIAAAVSIPVGVAYAADGTGTGHGPASGMTTGHDMDSATCPHHGDHALMREHAADMGGHMRTGGSVTGSGMASTGT